MAIPEKIEAVKAVGEMLNKQQSLPSAEELQRVPVNREHFQSLMDSTKPLQSVFQQNQVAPAESIRDLEKNPIFAEENVSSQKSGTATDQENKRQGRQSKEEEEVGGIQATGSKKSSNQSSSLIGDMKKLNTQVSQMAKLNPEELAKQAHHVISQMDQLKTQLSQTQTEIKPSYQNLLQNRLTHIDDNLRIALSKAGVEYTPPQISGTGKPNPIERFINSLASSQYQLEHLGQMIEDINLKGGQISPGNMLAIQIKMNHVQQQIELFTSLLNKALESTKTIMNVQV